MNDVFEHAAQAWLESADALGQSLPANDRARKALALDEIVAGGESVVARLGDAISPHRLANVHLRLTAAHVDLAVNSPDDVQRTQQVQLALEHADLAVAAAFETGSTIVPGDSLATTVTFLQALVPVLAGRQRQAIEARIGNFERQFRAVAARLRAHHRTASAALFASQSVLATLGALPHSSERRESARAALEDAKVARLVFISCGDFDAADQARATVNDLEAAIATDSRTS